MEIDVASQHPAFAEICAMLHCEKINASQIFRDLDSSSGVVYVRSALVDADIAWGKHGDPLGEGNAFIRSAHDARATAMRRFDTTINRTS